MTNFFLTIILLILLFGCSTKKISGKYHLKGSPENIILKNDSTFLYSAIYGDSRATGFSNGKWRIIGKKLYLSSLLEDGKYPISVTESFNNNVKGIKFEFDTIYSRKKGNIIWQELWVDKKKIKIDSNRILIDQEAHPIDSFKLVNYYANLFYLDGTYDPSSLKISGMETYYVRNRSSNFFTITYEPFNVDIFYYRYFNNERFSIKGKGLIWDKYRLFFSKE